MGTHRSKVDIVVCTPGRLVDHLQSTPGFNLTQLRFIVIDEADRMMEEVKHDWLELVERAVFQPTNQNTENQDGGDDDDLDDGVTMAMKRDTTDAKNRERIFDIVSSSPSLSSSLIHDHFNLLSAPHNSSHFLPLNSTHSSLSSNQRPRIHLQKLLFSATLSHNPEKLQILRLHHPKLFTSVVDGGGSGGKVGGGKEGGGKMGGVGGKDGSKVAETTGRPKRKVSNDDADDDDDGGADDDGADDDDNGPAKKKICVDGDGLSENKSRQEFLGKYTTPDSLIEHFIESDAQHKPLMLMHILKHMDYKSVLCFTNSVQKANRLSVLMKEMGVKAREFSSALHIGTRSRTIRAFNNNTINLIVASDAMSRGLDLNHVDCVVSYSVPSSFKTYIHRVGRTARAGASGTAVALLEKKEIFHFKKIMKESGKAKIKELKVQGCLVEKYKPAYEQALRRLPKTLDARKHKGKYKRKK